MGHVYVIEFGTGAVKVGHAVDPHRRFAQHRTNARAYGTTIARTWLSPDHEDTYATEQRLIRLCKQRWRLLRQEFFPDADFEAVGAIAEALPLGIGPVVAGVAVTPGLSAGLDRFPVVRPVGSAPRLPSGWQWRHPYGL